MKTLRQICAATILSLSLALSGSAGDIHSPGKASTGTGSTTTTTTTTTADTTTNTMTTVILTVIALLYS